MIVITSHLYSQKHFQLFIHSAVIIILRQHQIELMTLTMKDNPLATFFLNVIQLNLFWVSKSNNMRMNHNRVTQ